MHWSARSQRRPGGSPGSSGRYHAPALLLLASQAMYRFGYFGILASLNFFLQQRPYSWSPVNSTIATMLLNTFSYIASPLGGWLADAYLGRLNVAILGSILAFLASVPLPFLYWKEWNGSHQQREPCVICGSRQPNFTDTNMTDGNPLPSIFDPTDDLFFEEICSEMVMTCVVVLGIGTSLVWAVIAPLLADQYPDATVDFRRKLFNWFYFTTSLAPFLAILILCYVQQNVNIFWGFLIPSVALFLSLFLLLAALPVGLAVFRPTGSPLSTIFGVLAQAIRSWWRRRARCTRTKDEQSDDEESPLARRMATFKSVRRRNAVGVEPRILSTASFERLRFLDFAKVRYDGTYKEEEVEGVRSVIRVIVVLLFLIPYWTSYFQMETTFLLQGLYMDLNVNLTLKVPAAWLALFHVVTVLAMVPLMHYIFFPYLERKGVSMSLWCQMAVGLVLSSSAMLIAGVVELYRIKFYWGDGNLSPRYPCCRIVQTIGITQYSASSMSIFWQIPQYLLIGIGEIFATVSALNMAVTEAPRAMHAIATAGLCLSAGLGSLFGMILLSLANGKLLLYCHENGINARRACPHRPNVACNFSHFDYYFFILAGFGGLGTLLCLVVMRRILPASAGLRVDRADSMCTTSTVVTSMEAAN